MGLDLGSSPTWWIPAGPRTSRRDTTALRSCCRNGKVIRSMKTLRTVSQMAAVLVATCGLALSSHATILVSNTWNLGARTYPAAPTYSEMGVDSNSSGDLESAWYTGGSGGIAPTVNHMSLTNG